MFKSSSKRDDNDIELGLPLFANGVETSSRSHTPLPSGGLSPRFGPIIENTLTLSRPSSPKPLTPRLGSYQGKKAVSKWTWQNIVIGILSLYTLWTLFNHAKSQKVVPGEEKIAAYGGGPARKDLTHMIMVAGHAIWMGGPTNGVDEAEWTLLSYQKGSAATFIKHIEKGTQLATSDPKSLLIFSGGETRSFAGPLSEAQSYWSLAYAKTLLSPANTTGSPQTLFNRTATEEFSRDSYENLLFSICRFHEYTSNYPTHITIIGYEFKRKRFESVHRAALRYPVSKFTYVGIDPPKSQGMLQKELKNALIPFEKDPYGCWEETLVRKREGRNPFRTRHGYEATCPEIAGLVRWCGEEEMKKGRDQLYKGSLPWS